MKAKRFALMPKIRISAGLVFILFICSLFVSCDSSHKDSGNTHKGERYSINPDIVTGELKASQYTVDSILSLKIPESIIEMGVDKISLVDGRIIVLDTEVSQKLYVFDYRGNLVSEIGDRGRARNEFVGKPDDFFVDSKGIMHVFDKIGHRILLFNEDGAFDDAIEATGFYPYSLGLTGNDMYMMSFLVGHKNLNDNSESPSSLILLDKDCQNYTPLIPSARDLYYSVSGHHFFQDNERLSYVPSLSDSVYVFKNDILEKVVSFDFGEKTLCKEMADELNINEINSLISENQGVIGIKRYQETSTLVYLEYLYNHHEVLWLLNKKNGQIVSSPRLFEGIDIYSYFILSENQIIAYVDDKIVEGFKEFYNQPGFQENLKKSPDFIKDMLEGKIQAPALVFITLK